MDAVSVRGLFRCTRLRRKKLFKPTREIYSLFREGTEQGAHLQIYAREKKRVKKKEILPMRGSEDLVVLNAAVRSL